MAETTEEAREGKPFAGMQEGGEVGRLALPEPDVLALFRLIGFFLVGLPPPSRWSPILPSKVAKDIQLELQDVSGNHRMQQHTYLNEAMSYVSLIYASYPN